MKRTVLFMIVEPYADWEYALLATALQDKIEDRTSNYVVKTVSLTPNPVQSIGGFTTLPDYSIDDLPSDYAALILVGGYSWRTKEAKRVVGLAKKTCEEGKLLGAICDATVFLGMNGLLNDRKHTSNTLEDLTAAARGNYTGEENYIHEQAVRDGNLVTANGTGYLEFALEMLYALDAYPSKYIDDFYELYKLGYVEVNKRKR